MKENFYVTTPIYYGNGLPHVGHYYSSLIANTIHKYNKISGKNSRFTTGIDENSQKAVIEAEKAGLDIMDYLNKMAVGHKAVWDYFDFDYTDFIRTTEIRHKKLVQEVLTKCHNKGDIYEGEYEGMYCVGCEAFKKDDDLVFLNIEQNKTFPISDKVKINENIIKVCPDHLKTPDTIKEKNYFFKLKKYQTWMEEFYESNPDFVNPSFRFNEVIAFTKRGLEDFSISRETNTFGIPLPFDETQVTYVWFDALFNYYTSCKYSRGGDKNNEDFIDESSLWPADLHVVGKDIIRFHAIFWPAMLASYFDLGEEIDGVLHYKSSDLEKLPAQILATGFFTVDGQKMSKSIGNVIEPVAYSKEYSKELLSLYILSGFPIGNDGDYDRKDAILHYNAKLANNLGNLVNRVVVLSLKLGGKLKGEVSDVDFGIFKGLKDISSISSEIKEDGSKLIKNMTGSIRNLIVQLNLNAEKYFNQYDLKSLLDLNFKFLDKLNKYTDENEPWKLVKDNPEKAQEVLYTIAEGIRQVGLNLYCFFPEKMGEMFKKLGLEGYVEELESGKLQELRGKGEVFSIKEKGEALFARIDV